MAFKTKHYLCASLSLWLMLALDIYIRKREFYVFFGETDFFGG
jgi:hypothetical protein